MSDPFDCEGEISEVNPSTILFEFLGPSGERSVGFVKTKDVKGYDNSGAVLCKSFNVGDKLKCSVVKASKEGKEEDENSQHDWIATSAELTPNRNEMPAVSEDIIMHEGHQGNVLDSKEEEKKEAKDISPNHDQSISSLQNTAKFQKDDQQKDDQQKDDQQKDDQQKDDQQKDDQQKDDTKSETIRKSPTISTGKEEDENSQHDWIATSAELTPNRNEMPAVSEDIIMHEGHQGNVLDSKEEEKKEAKDISPNHDQSISSLQNTAKFQKDDQQKDDQQKDDQQKDEDDQQKDDQQKDDQQKDDQQKDDTKSETIRKSPAISTMREAAPVETEKAALIQLKPDPKQSGIASGRKVCSFAVFLILTGEHKNIEVVVSSSRIRLWGYTPTFLDRFLEYGDEVTIDYCSRKRRSGIDYLDGMIVWFGPKDLDKPASAATNADFASWLKKKDTTESQFVKWLNNKLPMKPFYPLISTLYKAKVCSMAFNANNVAVGAFIKIGSPCQLPSPLLTREEYAPPKAIAYLPREDFYVCGVPVQQANLCFLLWPNDEIMVQLSKSTNKTKDFYRHLLAQRPDLRVQYIAYFGNLGPERPKHVVVRPTTATDLPEFFKKKKLSMQDFEKVRRGTYWPAIPFSEDIEPVANLIKDGDTDPSCDKINTDKADAEQLQQQQQPQNPKIQALMGHNLLYQPVAEQLQQQPQVPQIPALMGLNVGYQPVLPPLTEDNLPFGVLLKGSKVTDPGSKSTKKFNTDQGSSKSSPNKTVAKQQPQQPEISSSVELDVGSWQHQPSKQVDVDVEKNNRPETIKKPEGKVSAEVFAFRVSFICRKFKLNRCTKTNCRFLHCSLEAEDNFLKTGCVLPEHSDLYSKFIIQEAKANRTAKKSAESSRQLNPRVIVPENRQNPEPDPLKDISAHRAKALQVITKIVNRILDLESPDDPKVKILLQDQDEVEMGINMAAVITKALMYSSQALPKKPAVADPLPVAANKRPNQYEDNFEQVKRSRLIERLDQPPPSLHPRLIERQEQSPPSQPPLLIERLDQPPPSLRPRLIELQDQPPPSQISKDLDQFRPRPQPLPGSRSQEEEDMARSRAQAMLSSRYDSALESFRSRDQALPGPRYQELRIERAPEAAYALDSTSARPRYEEPIDRTRREFIPRYVDQIPTQHRELIPERYPHPENLRERIHQQEPALLNKQVIVGNPQMYREELITNNQYQDDLRFRQAPSQSRPAPALQANPTQSRPAPALQANPTELQNPFHRSEEAPRGEKLRAGSSIDNTRNPDLRFQEDYQLVNTGLRQEVDYQPVITGFRREEFHPPVNNGLRNEEDYQRVNASLRREEVYQPVNTGLRREEDYQLVNTSLRREVYHQPMNTSLRREETYQPVNTDLRREEAYQPVNTSSRSEEAYQLVNTGLRREEAYQPVNTGLRHDKEYTVQELSRARREEQLPYNVEARARALDDGYQRVAVTAEPAAPRSLDYLNSDRRSRTQLATIVSPAAENRYSRPAVDQYSVISRNDEHFRKQSEVILNPFASDGYAYQSPVAERHPQPLRERYPEPMRERYPEPMRKKSSDRNTTGLQMVVGGGDNYQMGPKPANPFNHYPPRSTTPTAETHRGSASAAFPRPSGSCKARDS